MPDKRSASVRPGDSIGQSKLPSADSALQLLPISHLEFQARWSISPAALAEGTRAASSLPGATRLILRSYLLLDAPDHSNYSGIWHDYAIQRREDSAFFTLPKPAAKINAVLGLLNQAGRFSPLVRGDAVAMRPLPAPPFPRDATRDISPAPADKKLSYNSTPQLT